MRGPTVLWRHPPRRPPARLPSLQLQHRAAIWTRKGRCRALILRMILEGRAKLQMNSVHAIGASLAAGLGCAIGTKLFMYEHIESGLLHYRPIVEPELSRTLYVCEMADRPATYALEAVRSLILDLIRRSVVDGRWQARMVML
ncbi:LysR substrate-binding domain-containing protein [Mesorhizobium tianshanense]|nr:LysR substrate-binding domain-containing protein [Mesorhizobium tianshanense]